MGHIDGTDDGVGYAVRGTGNNSSHTESVGVRGTNPTGFYGVYGDAAQIGVYGSSAAEGGVGVHGNSSFNTGTGVVGIGPDGVIGISEIGGNGVTGRSSNLVGNTAGNGVWGDNTGTGAGVKGTSTGGDAVVGLSTSSAHAGVSATNDSGGFGMWARGTPGGHFESSQSDGVVGLCTSSAHAGVSATNDSGGFGMWARGTPGGHFESSQSDGVVGLCTSSAHAGVSATNDSGGFGVWARGTPAGYFEGDVKVTGDLCLVNQDCAEDFDIVSPEAVEPGTVMAIDKDGALQVCETAYDKRVAGVISGAGNLKPAIILGKQPSLGNRMPVALFGKVYCKVDASSSPIEVGDLLTTSQTPGYAMKALDPLKAFGAVIGKALRPLESGNGLIPILIALQ